MEEDSGQPIVLRDTEHACVMRWNLLAHIPQRDMAHIAVGTLADGGWYVDHTGFGTRRFTGRHAAWAAIRRLMDLHEGRWEEVPPSTELPHEVVSADGWRVLYSTSTPSLYRAWGRLASGIWGSYDKAIRFGRRLRNTRRHWERPGDITLRRYTDPRDRTTRYAIDDITGSDRFHTDKRHVTDHTDRAVAEERYIQRVLNAADDKYPFPWSDVDGVPLHVVKNPNRLYTTLYDGSAEYFGTRPGSWH